MIREGSGGEVNLMSISFADKQSVLSYSRVFTSRYLNNNSITTFAQGIFDSLAALRNLYVS